MTVKSTKSVETGCLQFSLGKITGQETPASEITISNISVMKVESDANDDNFKAASSETPDEGEDTPGTTPGDSSEDEPTGTEILKNKDFTNHAVDGTTAESWTAYIDASANANVSYADNKVTFGINNLGTADWNVQLKQSVTFEANHTYRVSCKASSTKDRAIKVVLMNESDQVIDGNWADKHIKYNITSEPTVITYEATCLTDKAGNGVFQISMGRLDDSTPASTITISDVSVLDITPSSDEEVSGGDVTDSTTTENLLNAEGWQIEKPESSEALTSNLSGTALLDSKVQLTITDVESACTNEWDLMLMNTGIKLEQDAQYKLSYIASATNSWNIKAQFSDSTGNINYDGYAGGAAISTTEEPKSFSFTMDNTTDEGAVLKFLLGCGSKDWELKNAGTTVITIKDIKLEKVN